MNTSQFFALEISAIVFGGAGYLTGVDPHRSTARWIGGTCAFLLTCLMVVVMVQGTFPILLPATLPYIIGMSAGVSKRLRHDKDCGCNHQPKR